MSLKILATIIYLSLLSADSRAQDTTASPSWSISVSADAYYRYDFNNPKDEPFNSYTSFTNSQNSFEPGMLSLKAEHSFGRAGMLADIGFGKRADEFSYNDKGSGAAIKQLYFTYSPASAIKLFAGSWVTHIGYESVDAYINRNYSMSYLFSYGPFFHTGIKSEVQIGKNETLMVGIVNPQDIKNAGHLPKMFIGQFTSDLVKDILKVSLNFQGGKMNDTFRLYQGDLILNYILSEKISLVCNGTVQARQFHTSTKWENNKYWWGSAIYLNADINEWFGLTMREEYFRDKMDVLGLNTGIFETTLSSNFKIDNLTLIPEFRFESAGRRLYLKSNGKPIHTTGSFVLALVYHFNMDK